MNFSTLIELDQRDIDEVLALIDELPHRHAIAIKGFLDRAYVRTDQRRQEFLDEYRKLVAEAEQAKEQAADNTVH